MRARRVRRPRGTGRRRCGGATSTRSSSPHPPAFTVSRCSPPPRRASTSLREADRPRSRRHRRADRGVRAGRRVAPDRLQPSIRPELRGAARARAGRRGGTGVESPHHLTGSRAATTGLPERMTGGVRRLVPGDSTNDREVSSPTWRSTISTWPASSLGRRSSRSASSPMRSSRSTRRRPTTSTWRSRACGSRTGRSASSRTPGPAPTATTSVWRCR